MLDFWNRNQVKLILAFELAWDWFAQLLTNFQTVFTTNFDSRIAVWNSVMIQRLNQLRSEFQVADSNYVNDLQRQIVDLSEQVKRLQSVNLDEINAQMYNLTLLIQQTGIDSENYTDARVNQLANTLAARDAALRTEFLNKIAWIEKYRNYLLMLNTYIDEQNILLLYKWIVTGKITIDDLIHNPEGFIFKQQADKYAEWLAVFIAGELSNGTVPQDQITFFTGGL